MPSIKRYQPITDAFTTHTIIAPASPDNAVTELAKIDGWVYVSVADNATLPEQSVTVEDVTLTDDLRDQLREASPAIQAIDRITERAIRARYSAADESRALRLGGAEEAAWRDFIAARVAEGETRKAALGLGKPASVPQRVDAAAARLALNAAGLRQAVEDAVAAAGQDVRDYWEYRTTIRRDHPIVLQLASTLGLTSEQLDSLFLTAAEIE